MGDRYILVLNCTYCNQIDDDVWYAPTCGSETFICKKCKKINFITQDFKTKKIKDITYEDIKSGFLNNTNIVWKEEEIKRMCKRRFEELKKSNGRQ